jgi:hypothetical protein
VATFVGRWTLVVLPLLIFPLVTWQYWSYPREAVYSFYRERGKVQTLGGLATYQSQNSEHFTLLYSEADRPNVALILEAAEAVYRPVVEQVGFVPKERVPLIVYSSRESLRQAFGWGNSESAMGVYWSGTIRLLSPNVWIEEESERERQRVFRKLNPIAHELTHYALDYLTNGNYPRWFTEGLAQRVEYRVTGFLWVEPESGLNQKLYSLDDLGKRFDTLTNQPLAYRQSYLLVDHLVNTCGEAGLATVIKRLGQGTSLSQAVEQTCGKTLPQLFADWEAQIHANESDLHVAN